MEINGSFFSQTLFACYFGNKQLHLLKNDIEFKPFIFMELLPNKALLYTKWCAIFFFAFYLWSSTKNANNMYNGFKMKNDRWTSTIKLIYIWTDGDKHQTKKFQ